MNLERTIERLEQRGYHGISSETNIKMAYVTKGNEITILTPSCGSLNLNIHNWDALKNEIDLIVNDMRGM